MRDTVFSINNKHVFITGGASGIGRATAAFFLDGGARVTVYDLQDDPGAENRGILHLTGSVTDERALAAALESACVQHGPLDVLINNAGIALDDAPIASTTLETFNTVLSVNLTGVLLGMKLGSPHMRDGGSIINTASLAAFASMPAYTGYSASKAGVVKLTQQAALELGSRGIRVNAICPGTTVTAMEPADSEEARLCRYTTALGRPGTAEEQAALYYFLACDESRYLTGQAINVDGGWLHGVTSEMSGALLGESCN